MRNWAREAGQTALEYFEQVDAEWKEGGSVVTEADRSIEQSLRTKIKSTFPKDDIVGEEFDDHRTGEADWSWFIDPIDGTAAFSMGLPVWSVSISAWSDHKKLGVIWAPYLEEEYYVNESGEVYKNEEPQKEQDQGIDTWNSQTLFCIPSTAHRTYEIQFPGKCRSLGSTAYHLALVVDGRATATLMGAIHIWDIAAGVAMGDHLNLTLKTIHGSSPDWESICNGGTPAQPLLFGRIDVVDHLIENVELVSETF